MNRTRRLAELFTQIEEAIDTALPLAEEQLQNYHIGSQEERIVIELRTIKRSVLKLLAGSNDE